MKRLFMFFMTVVVTAGLSVIASAQHGRSGSGGGRPATKGLDHSEAKANSHGDRGIEKAESRHVRHRKKNRKHRHSH